jgi:hypothetical protein
MEKKGYTAPCPTCNKISERDGGMILIPDMQDLYNLFILMAYGKVENILGQVVKPFVSPHRHNQNAMGQLGEPCHLR